MANELEPKCDNCEELASKCDCWEDNENMEEVLAFRLTKGLQKSEFLTPKE